MKGSTIGYLIAGVLIFFGVLANVDKNNQYSPSNDKETVEKNSDGRDIQLSDQASMGTYSEVGVCKAAIASLFFHSPSIMKVNQVSDEVFKVSYRRPSDNTLWENKCQIEGNRVHWGSFDGRWRNHDLDGVVLFMALGNDLTIQENHHDGSTSITRFTKQGDGSIVEVDA